jgi:hypothetical protein
MRRGAPLPKRVEPTFLTRDPREGHRKYTAGTVQQWRSPLLRLHVLCISRLGVGGEGGSRTRHRRPCRRVPVATKRPLKARARHSRTSASKPMISSHRPCPTDQKRRRKPSCIARIASCALLDRIPDDVNVYGVPGVTQTSHVGQVVRDAARRAGPVRRNAARRLPDARFRSPFVRFRGFVPRSAARGQPEPR